MTKQERMKEWESGYSMFDAVMWCENGEDGLTEETLIRAWQYLLDTGACWTLQGRFGRSAKSLIDAGVIVI